MVIAQDQVIDQRAIQIFDIYMVAKHYKFKDNILKLNKITNSGEKSSEKEILQHNDTVYSLRTSGPP